MRAAHRADRPGQPAQQALHDAERHLAAQHTAGRVDGGVHLLGGGQGGARRGHERLARRGRRHVMRGAVEQRRAELPLDRAHRRRDRRLHQPQPPGRRREPARLGHRHDHLHLPQLHDAHLDQR
jgi:hypothetical protein